MTDFRLIVGVMSGTSADGVDAALVRVPREGDAPPRVLWHHHRAYDPLLCRAIHSLRNNAMSSLSDLAWLGREISIAYSAAVNELLLAAGTSADSIAAVAAHGQTLYHAPPDTMQWLDPALLAAETGCAVVSDFRRADCAAGGQGAPLVPYADCILFHHPEKNRVLLNLGGIANLTFIPATGADQHKALHLDQVIAFDTGPGNCISDYVVRQYVPDGPGWDDRGQWAARGVPIYPLVQRVLAAPYFAQSPPKSTDGPAMIRLFTDALADMGRRYPPEYLLRSACLVTADTILQAMRQFLSPFPDEIIVSGGGVKNETLMSLLRQPLGEIPLRTTDELGIISDAKEAVAFALLAAATLDGRPSNIPAATGARRPVVLGSITPKP